MAFIIPGCLEITSKTIRRRSAFELSLPFLLLYPLVSSLPLFSSAFYPTFTHDIKAARILRPK
jgi:hypothetical protein